MNCGLPPIHHDSRTALVASPPTPICRPLAHPYRAIENFKRGDEIPGPVRASRGHVSTPSTSSRGRQPPAAYCTSALPLKTCIAMATAPCEARWCSIAQIQRAARAQCHFPKHSSPTTSPPHATSSYLAMLLSPATCDPHTAPFSTPSKVAPLSHAPCPSTVRRAHSCQVPPCMHRVAEAPAASTVVAAVARDF